MLEREYTEHERALVRKTPESAQQLLIDNNFDVFYEAVYQGYDVCDFITKFMHSEVAALMDFHLNYYRWKGKESIFPDFLEECMDKGIELAKAEIDESRLRGTAEKAGWIGYIYRLAHFKTGETSAEIVDFMPAEMMTHAYYAGHCEDPDGWIENYYYENDYEKYVKYFEPEAYAKTKD